MKIIDNIIKNKNVKISMLMKIKFFLMRPPYENYQKTEKCGKSILMDNQKIYLGRPLFT